MAAAPTEDADSFAATSVAGLGDADAPPRQCDALSGKGGEPPETGTPDRSPSARIAAAAPGGDDGETGQARGGDDATSAAAGSAASALAPAASVPAPAVAGGEAVIAEAADATSADSAGAGGLPCSDRKIIEVLAAESDVYERLQQTAMCVPEILMGGDGDDNLATSVELYGSMALGEGPGPKAARKWQQDWPSYYVNGQSDVDFVVQMKPGVAAQTVAQKLITEGPWRLVGQVHVHKFASTQYTLLGCLEKEADEEDGESSTEVYLDITCVEDAKHFKRFKRRQEAFRTVFLEVRAKMEEHYSAQGVLAFDAYVHLLKAFAAKIPGNALTGFQATCIGLFTLQIGFFRLKLSQTIALSLFEGFLRFCVIFYGDSMRSHMNHRLWAIDLSHRGRWLQRMSGNWRSEVYFMEAEDSMGTLLEERMNVAHSLDPARVSSEASDLLQRTFKTDGSSLGSPGEGTSGRAQTRTSTDPVWQTVP